MHSPGPRGRRVTAAASAALLGLVVLATASVAIADRETGSASSPEPTAVRRPTVQVAGPLPTPGAAPGPFIGPTLAPTPAPTPAPQGEPAPDADTAPSAPRRAAPSAVADAPSASASTEPSGSTGSTGTTAPRTVAPVVPVTPVVPSPATAAATFRVGTLNILGSQHRAGGPARAASLAGAIVDRDVDVVGLQEVQSDQLDVLQARLTGYALWPARALGNQGLRLQVAYRTSRFELVVAGWITTTFDHQERPVPWVQLRERASGRLVAVVDIHNSPGRQSADRWSATTEEIELVRRLRVSGQPVLVVGDTNEPTATACRLARETGVVGSNGLGVGGGCQVRVGPTKIDHVLGAGVSFTDHVVDLAPPVRTATDHSFVHATVTLDPQSTAPAR